MARLLTREELEKLTKPQILDHIRARKLTGYSQMNRPELINFYLNPPAGTVSPGRPKKAVTAAAVPAEKKKTGPKSLPKNQTVNYTKEGLSVLTGKFLAQLIEKKGVTGYSNKVKEERINLLLAKPHREAVQLTVVKDGVASTVTILPTALS